MVDGTTARPTVDGRESHDLGRCLLYFSSAATVFAMKQAPELTWPRRLPSAMLDSASIALEATPDPRTWNR